MITSTTIIIIIIGSECPVRSYLSKHSKSKVHAIIDNCNLSSNKVILSLMAFEAAKYYDSHSIHQSEDGLNLIKLLAPQRGGHVLDLGCGTGYLSKVLADLVGPEGQIVAIDPDVERLKIAKDKHNAENIRYLEGSSKNLPGGEGEFDIVFSNYVIHWIKDKAEVFRDVAEVLKKGGRFGFTTINSFDIVKECLTPAEMFSPECRDAIMNSTHTIHLDDYKSIFSSHNYEVVCLKEHVQRLKFSDIAELIAFYIATLTHGRFDRSHFNIEAMRGHYGEGEVVMNVPLLSIVIQEML